MDCATFRVAALVFVAVAFVFAAAVWAGWRLVATGFLSADSGVGIMAECSVKTKSSSEGTSIMEVSVTGATFLRGILGMWISIWDYSVWNVKVRSSFLEVQIL